MDAKCCFFIIFIIKNCFLRYLVSQSFDKKIYLFNKEERVEISEKKEEK
jgi:hypothetical protein